MSDERSLTQDDVRSEHLASVNMGAQALYITGVILGGMLLMLLLIAVLGGSSS